MLSSLRSVTLSYNWSKLVVYQHEGHRHLYLSVPECRKGSAYQNWNELSNWMIAGENIVNQLWAQRGVSSVCLITQTLFLSVQFSEASGRFKLMKRWQWSRILCPQVFMVTTKGIGKSDPSSFLVATVEACNNIFQGVIFDDLSLDPSSTLELFAYLLWRLSPDSWSLRSSIFAGHACRSIYHTVYLCYSIHYRVLVSK